MLYETSFIPSSTLKSDTTYTFSITVSDNCGSKERSVTVQTVSYPTAQITTPTPATFLAWWQSDGAFLGCSECSATTLSPNPTCTACFSPLQLISGNCLCSDENSYIDLTSFPAFKCLSKSSSVISWSLKQKYPTIQMQTKFSNGFSSSSGNMNYTASIIDVTSLNSSIVVKNYSATVEEESLLLTFSITQDVEAGINVGITNLSQYNKIPYSPFLIENLNPTYRLPAVTYMSPEAVKIIGAASAATAAAMQAQAVTTSILPAVTGGLSTSAMLLVSFLEEVDLYKYINVPFPDNFIQFCEALSTPILPNIFANMDTVNEGNNPNSTIGKFQFWGVSSMLLDNSYTQILKELMALGIIVLSSLLTLIFKSQPKAHNFFSKIRNLFVWNVFLSFYLGDYSELQLNSMIQLREHSVTSAYAYFSLSISIIIVTTYALLKIYICYIINKKRKTPSIPQQQRQGNQLFRGRDRSGRHGKKQTSRRTKKGKLIQISIEETWNEIPASMQIISEDFTPKNRFTRNFFLVMILQSFFLILLVFFFQAYGLAQAIVYTIFTVVYVAIIVWQRPYKSKVQMAILLINQSSKIGMGIIAIIIGVNEQTQSVPQSSITSMGLALIVLIVTVIGMNLLISIVMTVISVYQTAKALYERFRRKKSKEIEERNNRNSSNYQNHHHVSDSRGPKRYYYEQYQNNLNSSQLPLRPPSHYNPESNNIQSGRISLEQKNTFVLGYDGEDLPNISNMGSFRTKKNRRIFCAGITERADALSSFSTSNSPSRQSHVNASHSFIDQRQSFSLQGKAPNDRIAIIREFARLRKARQAQEEIEREKLKEIDNPKGRKHKPF